jgi:dolichol-phosphate mannosyltransferase
MEAARGSWVAVIDCDLQDNPGIIPKLYEKALLEVADAIVVDRGDWSDTGFRRSASRLFYWAMNRITGIQLDNNIGNFGLYSRRLVEILLTFRDKEVFLPVMISLTGLPRATYKVNRSGRQIGASSYSVLRLMRMAVAVIIRFSDRPLKLSIVAGLAFSTLSVLCSVFILAAWATGAFTVPGWTSLILSLWFLAGLILAVLGVHGFYVGRIFAEVQDRPRILVEQTTDAETHR